MRVKWEQSESPPKSPNPDGSEPLVPHLLGIFFAEGTLA